MVGVYHSDSLPLEILGKISKGLTKIEEDGSVKPDIAEKWKISPNGRGYAFYLRKDIYFSDGKNLTSEDVNYNFTDVSVLRPDKHTIVFNLKDNYSPFLVTVSKPIFRNGLVGVGSHEVKKIKLNGNFVEFIELYSESLGKTLVYELSYPTQDALKTAFMLGEVSVATKLPDLKYKDEKIDTFENVIVEKKVDKSKLVTLFYDTKDKTLSSKTLREALSYAIPDNFKQGERNIDPIPYFSYANQNVTRSQEDLEHAKLLIEKFKTETEIKNITLTIDVLVKYKDVAQVIADTWKKLNIKTKINLVDQIPTNFQIFLGEFNVSPDPDQYALWHSSQPNNIAHYSNLRIDKLLEDGRKELNIQKRIVIYADFQKYLLSDPPASFLFFPYYYEVTRK